MKNERGITIASLVITIVIMLILSGVAIYVGIGEGADGGVINAVKEETEYQQNTIEDEKNKMNIVLKRQEEDWGID